MSQNGRLTFRPGKGVVDFAFHLRHNAFWQHPKMVEMASQPGISDPMCDIAKYDKQVHKDGKLSAKLCPLTYVEPGNYEVLMPPGGADLKPPLAATIGRNSA